MSYSHFGRNIVKEAPCSGCKNESLCGEKALACQLFENFILEAGNGSERKNIHKRPTNVPSKAIYNKIYAHEGHEAAGQPRKEKLSPRELAMIELLRIKDEAKMDRATPSTIYEYNVMLRFE